MAIPEIVILDCWIITSLQDKGKKGEMQTIVLFRSHAQVGTPHYLSSINSLPVFLPSPTKHRQHKQKKYRRHRKAADDGNCQRLLHLRARAYPDGK
jgi:hypothetical protein